MEHIPVFLNEVLNYLNPGPGDIIFDATGGGGGHSGQIIDKILPNGKLIIADKDPEAVLRLQEKFKDKSESVIVVKEDFRRIKEILSSLKINKIDGAVFDLGMSSFHIDDKERGFSFKNEGPLDMRFDTETGITAKEIVNTFRQDDLEDIIKTNGEERFARRVAKAICESRKKEKIESTGQLKDIINTAIGRNYSRQKLHPAARTFQALRICVNDELEAEEEGILGAIETLREGGRICVISFHSLEDRIAKMVFRRKKIEGEITILTKKPLVPNRDEIRNNSRASSAKLRVAERGKGDI
jgi:16S rRNA (cytosine1402-N4)-methyltransferase